MFYLGYYYNGMPNDKNEIPNKLLYQKVFSQIF